LSKTTSLGRNIDLWRDNWLPRDYNLKVTPGKTRSRIRRVSQLLLPENQAWNEELVEKVCYSYDAEWILKQKLPSNPCDDFVAWHSEKSGIFSVKSAYRLAYNLSQGTRWKPGNSHSLDNTRNVWKMFWNANVPKKVKKIGWRVARDNLATKRNKMRRSLETDGMCNICGREEEDSFHATVNCTKARALRYEMRKHWSLPPEHNFAYSGPEWLQNLLLNSSQSQRSKVLMLLWRSWHLRNDIVHGKGLETISRSAAFLTGYDNFLQDPIDSR
jgi:hypothetical protein